MKRYFYIIIVLISVIGVNAHAADLPEFPFVFASGEAETDVKPNIATVSFSVQEFNEISDLALETVQDRSIELLVFFAELKIKKEDIVAYEIDKKAIRERKDYNELKILGYEVTRLFSVTLRDINNYEKLATRLLSLKNVVNINTEFDRTDRKEIEAGLMAEAGKKAKDEAELMAKGFGVELGSVFAISQQGFGRLGATFGVEGYQAIQRSVLYDMERVVNQKEILFVPSTITLKATVAAIFRLQAE